MIFRQDVFVWIGESSSEVERKLALKSAQLYQQHIQDLTGFHLNLILGCV